MRILCVHAHFDDFEFVASGTFELWRRKLGASLRARVIVCTDGQAGHHFRTRAETARIRFEEQQASAAIGGYEPELLRYPDGVAPREACLQADARLMAALWRSIRDFEPDYLFCPPLPSDWQAGIHNDHVAVAEAVRKTAYMINVPHAFTVEYPADEQHSEPKKTPVILATHDGYMGGANSFDLAIDVAPAFDQIAQMSFCHQSQIMEWLPWVGRHQMSAPKSADDWKQTLRKRFRRRSRELGLPESGLFEVFTVTAWGGVARLAELLSDFPAIDREHSRLAALEQKLMRWQTAG